MAAGRLTFKQSVKPAYKLPEDITTILTPKQIAYVRSVAAVKPRFNKLSDLTPKQLRRLVGRLGGEIIDTGSAIVVDPLAPAAPTLDLVAGSDTGSSSTDNITSDTMPDIDFITAQVVVAGDILKIFDNGVQVASHTVTAGEAGLSTVALGLSALSDGVHSLTATHTVAGPHTSPSSVTLPITIDTTAPTLSSTVPTDNATGVTNSANLTATFSENVVFGTGNFTIKKTSDNTTVEAFDVATEVGTGNGQISISGAVVTINPTTTLPEIELYVVIDATAIDDIAGNSYAGLASTTAWSFTVADTTAPTISSLSPLDNATGVLVGANLVATFSENVLFNSTVSITLKKTSDNSTIQAFTEADIGGAISISGAALTINPTSDLANSTEYYVLIDATSVKDAAGNFFAGIVSTTAWSFTTQSSSSFTTFNPADIGTRVALSNGNLTATNNGSTGAAMVRSVSNQSNGKYYWEITIGSTGSSTLGVGIADSIKSLNATFLGGDTHGVGYYSGGGVSFNSATAQTIQTFTTGDVIGIAIDIPNKGIWFRKNGGNWNNSGVADPTTNTLSITLSTTWAVWNSAIFACVDVEKGTVTVDSVTANFGATAFANAAPSGFGTL